MLVVLIAYLPFEFLHFPVMSNLQWLFLAVAVTALPMLIRERRTLLRHRLVIAALVFVVTQWLAALFSAEYTLNAVKGAVRMTAAFTLLCITLCMRDRETLLRVWGISAVVAALYAILDYGGFGVAHLFRDVDFRFGPVQRLSGSFEYPNTAAAFFGLSLPVVWTTLKRHWVRIPAFLALWLTLVLTYSRGATIAALMVMLIWAITGRKRSALLPVALCTAVFAALLAFEPVLIERFRAEPIGTQSAQYRPEFNRIQRHPNEAGDLVVELVNTGTETWGNQGRPFTLTPRWYDPEQRKLVRTAMTLIPIPAPVRPWEPVPIRVPFRTPPHPGLYLLTFDISQSGTGWFSANGVFPGLVEVQIERSGEPWSGNGDISRWHARPITQMFVQAPFSRRELWAAAVDMIVRHPLLGNGPDNFRLLYGRIYGVDSWDTTVRSNSLYLELLTGSGLAGLTAFAFVIGTVRRKAGAPALAIGFLLLHGFVDDFLMTTPIYFGFWILLAQASPIKSDTQHPAVADLAANE